MQKLSESKQFCFDFSRQLWLDYIGLFLSCVKMTMQMSPLPNCRRPKGNQAVKRKLWITIPLPDLFEFYKHIWTREYWKAFQAMCWGGMQMGLRTGNILITWVILWIYLISELLFLHLQDKWLCLRTAGCSGWEFRLLQTHLYLNMRKETASQFLKNLKIHHFGYFFIQMAW